MDQQAQTELEKGLDSFDPNLRKTCLQELVAAVNDGFLTVPEPQETANLHCHSFYSFNAYGYSPSHLAWLGRKNGIKFMGIVDFDILDGIDEFLDGCSIAGVRGTAGLETRVYIPEFKSDEINSPGEPGISYHMGVGFIRSSITEPARPIFADIRQTAVTRNFQIVERINEYLKPLQIDFTTDVLPLSPSGYITERHIVHKVAEKSLFKIDDPVQFWSAKLKQNTEFITGLIKDQNAFKDFLRKTLIKRGGVAYVQPESKNFPTVELFHEIILSEGALPCITWLDGTSSGEADIERLLDVLISKGAVALNIIPDRNWNINDPEMKAIKVNNLYKIVDLAEKVDLPIIVGTEMNSFGQKIVDNFDTPELAPVKDRFLKGAYFLFGHTAMERYWGLGYQSEWANNHLPNRKTKNAFYEAMGRFLPAGSPPEFSLSIDSSFSPDQILGILKDNNKD